MHSWRIADLVQITHGTLLRGDDQQQVHGVSIDSRTVQAGELFIALQGERFDGHQFAPAAIRQGAAAILVSDAQAALVDASETAPSAVLLVADTLVALQDLARAHRHRLPGTVVAITGSNGKTTVKEMTAAVLQTRFATYKAPGNFNNHIGLPMALLRMVPAHDVGVFELGMNHLGEICQLCAIAQPHIGVVTNIGLAHVGYLGSIECIQQAKGELIEALDASGVAIVNADDPRALALGQLTSGRLITFGLGQGAEVRGRLQEDRGLQGVQCTLEIQETVWEVELPLPGVHNVMNALAAAAVGVAMQVSGADIVAGMQTYRGMYGRLAMRRGRGDVILIDDTYNANPHSMQVALRFLAHVPTTGRRLAVLGDMLELGDAAPALHLEVGDLAARSQVQHLIALGPLARYIVQGARDAGMAEAQMHYAADQQEALALLEHLQRPGDIILLKGSRGMAMEHLVHALAGDAGEP
jgi:UDP-N-acetylmuramoyl-tripeptide--D-alanyl-D-alanine ligase